MVEVVILLGGNLGDVRANLALSRELIAARVGRVKSQSSELTTQAWGFSAEELFLNQALLVETSLLPEELLVETQAIEQVVGRDRAAEMQQTSQSGERYASRVIDVDIITYGSQVVDTEGLVIPHPRMHQREFVLRPMAELAPEWLHPTLKMSTAEMLKNITK